MTDSEELSHGEKQIKAVLNDLKGTLTGINNMQRQIGTKFNQMLGQVGNLETELREFRKEFQSAQLAASQNNTAAKPSLEPPPTVAGSPPKNNSR